MTEKMVEMIVIGVVGIVTIIAMAYVVTRK
jgi:hypothetical protein